MVPLSLTFMMFAIAYFANQSFIVNYVQSRHLPVSSDLFFHVLRGRVIGVTTGLARPVRQQGLPFLADGLLVGHAGDARMHDVPVQ